MASALQADGSDLAAVVASQGHYDEPALDRDPDASAAVRRPVASRKRGATVRADLEAAGVAGAWRPSATWRGSILVRARRQKSRCRSLPRSCSAQPSGARVDAGVNPPAVAVAPATAVDPVCQMTVEVATARHTAALDGVTYDFCCPHCRARFVKEPHAYLGKGA